MIRQGKVLIDRVRIYNYTVVDVEDYDKCLSKGIITKISGAENYLFTKDGFPYSSLVIKSNDDRLSLKSLNYSIDRSGKIKSTMEVVIPNEGVGNLNCYTAAEYFENIKRIKEDLRKSYGIVVDFSEARYGSMELNKTIILEKPFYQYDRPIRVLMCSLPKRLRLEKEMMWY